MKLIMCRSRKKHISLNAFAVVREDTPPLVLDSYQVPMETGFQSCNIRYDAILILFLAGRLTFNTNFCIWMKSLICFAFCSSTCPAEHVEEQKNQAYQDAHKEANNIDKRHKDNYDGYNTKDGTMLQSLDNPSKTMLLPYPKKKN